MVDKPSYYSIIPATVRYDDDLKANEKLLYGEITALANKHGYSWAENNYFAKLYGVHKKTVSSWMTNLEKNGYIKIKLEYIKGTKQVKKRYIYINDTPLHKKMDRVSTEKWIGYPQKDSHPIHEKMEEELNNTSMNNTSINKDHSPAKAERIPYKKIIDYLNGKTGKNYSHTAKGNKSYIQARWNEGFRFDDFKKVIDIKVSEWSNDKKMSQYLRPQTLFNNKFDMYRNQYVKPKPKKVKNNNSFYSIESMVHGGGD